MRKTLVTIGLILAWIGVVLVAVVANAFWFGAPPVERGDVDSIEKYFVEKLTEAAEKKRLGSAALVLLRGGEIAAEHGFGVGNAESAAPVKTDQTLFQVASVSKAVTAWGVMKLVEEGKLGLDDPVMLRLRRWQFPTGDAHRHKVTVRHLLSHTAGLDDGLGYGGFPPGQKPQTLEESLTLTKDSTVGAPRGVRVAFEPGTGLAYSGGGYTLLQLLIEEITQRPFAGYMRESVLLPLGMTRSSFDVDAVIAEGRENELAPNFDRALKVQPRRRYTALAAVALLTTARDLARLAQALAGDNPVLRPETMELMLTPQPGTSGSWGLGHTIYVEKGAAGHVIGHSGGTGPAWGAMLRVNRATGNGLVLMVSGGDGSLNQLVHDWVWWETGQVTPEGRRQRLYDSARPALIGILLGAVVIVVVTVRRSRADAAEIRFGRS